jgi:cobalt-zinc-cadmium efflux system membrane fusion protein
MPAPWIRLAIASGIALVGCDRRGDQANGPRELPSTAAAHVDEPPHAEIPKTVRLPEGAAEAAKITTAKVVREILSPSITLAGELVADPDKSARIAAPLPGRVVDVSVKEGATVRKGDVVVRIAVPDLGRVRAAHAAALARARAARADEKRLEGLTEKRLRPEQEWLDAKASAEAFEAEVRGLEAQLAALGFASKSVVAGQIALTAPLSGVVLARDAVVGQSVGPDQVLLRVADLEQAWFLARVFEKDLAHVRVGAAAEVVLNAYPNETFAGTVEAIGREVDPAARTVVARIVLRDRDALLRIGLFGSARVVSAKAEERAPVLVVPASAVTDLEGKPIVFVAHADGDFEVHEVVLGERAPGKVEIARGLREGEVVVVSGAYNLKSIVLRSTLEED